MWRPLKIIILLAFLLLLQAEAESAVNPVRDTKKISNSPIVSNGVKIEASLDKSKVSTGERFTYTLTLKGIFQKPRLEPPEFKDFRIVSQSQSQSYSLRKSGTELTLKLIYVLLASEAGKFTISPAKLKDKTGEYKSNPLVITVEGKSLPEKQKILPYLENSTDL